MSKIKNVLIYKFKNFYNNEFITTPTKITHLLVRLFPHEIIQITFEQNELR